MMKKKRTGGTAKRGHRNKPVTDGDVYFQPDIADEMFDLLLARHRLAHPIFEEVNGHRIYADVSILDVCANTGVLGKSLLSKIPGGKLTLQDIKISGKSFLDENYKGRKFDYIVANPPWKEAIAKPIYQKCLELLSHEGVLFFVINNVFQYQGRDRAVQLKCHKFYFLPRYVFKRSGRPLLDCGVMVYHNGVENASVGDSCFLDVARKKETL